MTPFHKLNLGEELADSTRERLFSDHGRSHPVLAVLQYLRDEALVCLSESIKARTEGKVAEADIALGGFDRLSQAVVKIHALSEQKVSAPK